MGKNKVKVYDGIEIVDTADKGMALGKNSDGMVFLVEDAVPGDIVTIEVRRKKKGLPLGIVQKVTQESPYRVKPVCSHFDNCGGCKWQNLDYQRQLYFKQKLVTDVVSKIAQDNATKVLDIIGSKQIYHYRNKMEYAFCSKRWLTNEEIASQEKFDNLSALGLNKAGFYDKVIDISQCHLQDSLGDAIRAFIKNYGIEHNLSFFDRKLGKGFLRTLMLRNTTLGNWMVLLVFGQNDEKSILALMQAFSTAFPNIRSINYVINPGFNDSFLAYDIINYSGDEYIEERLGEVYYKISPKSFFQTNSRQAEVLFGITSDFAELKQEDHVYDLYCGAGSIGLFLANKCKSVIGVEVIPDAIEDAKINACRNNISNAKFFVGDVKTVFDSDFVALHGSPDVIIIDPPREGLNKDVIETILAHTPDRLVYVSCNPATQGRDILLLKEKYELIKIQPIDMFPHTHHVESIAALKLKIAKEV